RSRARAAAGSGQGPAPRAPRRADPWWPAPRRAAPPRGRRRSAAAPGCGARRAGAAERSAGYRAAAGSYELRPRPDREAVDDQHDDEDHQDDQADAGVIEEVEALLQPEADAARPDVADDHRGAHVDLEDVEDVADHGGGHLRQDRVD